MKRASIEDIAREAGVSKATVDRVIHSRGFVRSETARKVAEAAHRIAYYASGLIDQQLALSLPKIRFGFLLIKEKQEFYQTLSRAMQAEVARRNDFRGHVTIRFSPSQSPAVFAAMMCELADEVDVIACTAVNHHVVDEAAAALRERGVSVLALLNDFAPGVRAHYLGLDNLKAGRLAAWMIRAGTREPGKVALFLGSNRWQGHELRETSFRSHLRDTGTDLVLLDPIINLETRTLTHETSLGLLRRHADIKGIYVAGGGMEGAIAALREMRGPGEVALVVHELTTISRAALADGYATMVIGTPLTELCQKAVSLMAQAVRNREERISGQHFLEPQLFLPPSVQA